MARRAQLVGGIVELLKRWRRPKGNVGRCFLADLMDRTEINGIEAIRRGVRTRFSPLDLGLSRDMKHRRCRVFGDPQAMLCRSFSVDAKSPRHSSRTDRRRKLGLWQGFSGPSHGPWRITDGPWRITGNPSPSVRCGLPTILELDLSLHCAVMRLEWNLHYFRWVIGDGEPELHVDDVFDWFAISFWSDAALKRVVLDLIIQSSSRSLPCLARRLFM